MTSIRTILAGGVIALAAGTVAIAGLSWVQQAAPVAAPAAGPAATAEIVRGRLVDTRTVGAGLALLTYARVHVC